VFLLIKWWSFLKREKLLPKVIERRGGEQDMQDRGMSIIKDAAKARIGTDRETLQPRSGYVKHHSKIEMERWYFKR
jgi:hypothetical protein